MTRRLLGLIVGVMGLVGASVWVAAQSGSSALEGVWAVQDITRADPSSAPTANAPTGFIMFTGRHYSMMYLYTTARPDIEPSEVDTASADELRAVWGPLTAHAGTFDVSGNTLTTHPTVAKMPYVMAKGGFGEWSYTVNGDTLVLTIVRGAFVSDPWTVRLRRVQ